MDRQCILTADGSHTILAPELGDHYHSVYGAIAESRHVFLGFGYRQVNSKSLSILEVGFGTGLNAFVTLLETFQDQVVVRYEAWEAFPLPIEEVRLLNYPSCLDAPPGLFLRLHEADWGTLTPITGEFSLMKVKGDIREFHSNNRFDLVYFDAFGPDCQPELWQTSVFSSIRSQMNPGSRLVTYSAKGQVRRNLRDAGFRVEKVPGPPGKREMTIALMDWP